MSQSTLRVAVESSTTRAHARSSTSPAGTHAVLAVSQRRPSSQTESSTRSSFVSISGSGRPAPSGGWDAKGGCDRRSTDGDATSCTRTGAGGMPSTVRRWTTREEGSSTDTTYSVAVDESDCTGAKLE